MKSQNVTKYIQKLKASNLQAFVIRENQAHGLKEVFHPGIYLVQNK
jgi:hypothetical protein